MRRVRRKAAHARSSIVVRIPFTNPLMVGKFAFHCHIVQHADQGMMANIEVVAPASSDAPGTVPGVHGH